MMVVGPLHKSNDTTILVRCHYCCPRYHKSTDRYLMTWQQWVQHLSEKHKLVQVVNESVTISTQQEQYRDIQREAEYARIEWQYAHGYRKRTPPKEAILKKEGHLRAIS